jgi:hypothetical protein
VRPDRALNLTGRYAVRFSSASAQPAGWLDVSDVIPLTLQRRFSS